VPLYGSTPNHRLGIALSIACTKHRKKADFKLSGSETPTDHSDVESMVDYIWNPTPHDSFGLVVLCGWLGTYVTCTSRLLFFFLHLCQMVG